MANIGSQDFFSGCVATSYGYDVFFKGDPAGLRIRIRLERYEDDREENIRKYLRQFTSFHGYDFLILHVPNGYIEVFPHDRDR